MVDYVFHVIDFDYIEDKFNCKLDKKEKDIAC